jgi:hypothetical protein
VVATRWYDEADADADVDADADADDGANVYAVVVVDGAADAVKVAVVMATAVAAEVDAAALEEAGAQHITVSQQQKIGVEPLKYAYKRCNGWQIHRHWPMADMHDASEEGGFLDEASVVVGGI